VPVDTADRTSEVVAEIKPRLRGWLHLGSVPFSLLAGVVLVALAPDGETRLASAVFALSGTVLFGVSALLHRANLGPSLIVVARRLDHASIFVLIAGSYTPFAVLLLGRHDAWVLLGLAWGVAALGIVFRLAWAAAPRWLYTLVYCVMGSGGAFWIRAFAASADVAVIALLAAGGALYLLGGLVYGVRRPNPSPRWFGFHEVFHSLTVAGFTVHYMALSILVYGRR
jgi:hemolysin III